MLDWMMSALDAMPPEEVRQALGLTQQQMGALLGCSRSAILRAELGEHEPDPLAVAQGEPLPSWRLRVGCRRTLIVWVLLAIEDPPNLPSRDRDIGYRSALNEAFRRLRILSVTAAGLHFEGVPEAWALALRMQAQADTWVPLRPLTHSK